MHLGNLLGALRHWVHSQHDSEAIHCIVDLHAITIPQNPAELRAATLRLTQLLVAVGLDPKECVIFVQSHVREHTELAWLLQCTVSFGELRRMNQFKEKSADADFVSAGLFTYPALQAADILLYDTDEVPVGDDQRQHLELSRDAAMRFNSRYGDTFVVPRHRIASTGARVMDLQNPEEKMSKSSGEAPGTIWLLDDPSVIRRKIRRAVTDSLGEVRYDPDTQPGVSNLLDILGASTDRRANALAEEYDNYGALKDDCAEAVIALLEPIQRRYDEMQSESGETLRLLADGAERAREVASRTMARAREAVGFLSCGGSGG